MPVEPERSAPPVHPERSRGIPLGALLSTLLLTACVTDQAAKGGEERAVSEWVEIHTEHFRVRAQLDEQAAFEAARSLEVMRAGVLAYFGARGPPKDHLDVLVYRDASSLADFVATGVAGFVAQGSNGPSIVTSAAGLHDPAFVKVMSHEIAHHVSATLMPRQPRWLSEGLAEYLETFDIDPVHNKVTYGKPPGSVGPADLSGAPITLAQLWDWTTQDDLTAQRAAWAWWLVSYLANTYAERFDVWQRAIGRGDEPRQSWDRTFAGLSDSALEAEILGALKLRQLKFQKIDFDHTPGDADVVKLDLGDIHVARAELLLQQSSPLDFEYRRATATAELEAALARDPYNADARVLKARLISDPVAARAFAQKMVEDLPQNAKAWGLMASLMGRDGEDPRGTLQFALALAPNHPGLLNTLAWYSALYDDKAAGMKLAELAATLRPWSAAMVDTHAAALGAAGRCPEAAIRQRQALDLLVHGSAGQRAAYLEKLRAYETQCTRATPTALRR